MLVAAVVALSGILYQMKLLELESWLGMDGAFNKYRSPLEMEQQQQKNTRNYV